MAQEKLNENVENVENVVNEPYSKTFRIYARQYPKKDGKGSFFGYTKVNGVGKATHQVKCTMNCGTLPIKEQGYYLIQVDKSTVSIQHAKPNADGKKYLDVLWLQERPITCVRDVDYEAKIKALKEKEVQEILDDDLPF